MVGENVITFGVWDLFHTGHLDFIIKSRRMGSRLIVGVQSDESVASQKGYRPTINEKDRCRILESLKYVDEVFVYSDLTYENYVKEYDARVVTLSSAYSMEDRFKKLRAYMFYIEGKVKYIKYQTNVSTTSIKDHIKESWVDIWDRVANSDKTDYELVGHNEEQTKQLADYIYSKVGDGGKLLDHGCGTGVLFPHLKGCSQIVGVDISGEMLKRAEKYHMPNCLLIKSDTIPYSHYNTIISFGVIHYIPELKKAKEIVLQMKELGDRVMLMEIPDMDKREARIAKRRELGKIIDPEPLYFSKQWFIDEGFEVYDTELKISDNSDFSFTAVYFNPILPR